LKVWAVGRAYPWLAVLAVLLLVEPAEAAMARRKGRRVEVGAAWCSVLTSDRCMVVVDGEREREGGAYSYEVGGGLGRWVVPTRWLLLLGWLFARRG
jgi:hypothetical protein